MGESGGIATKEYDRPPKKSIIPIIQPVTIRTRKLKICINGSKAKSKVSPNPNIIAVEISGTTKILANNVVVENPPK